jgi:dipeptidyl aminopeptidase/acylaminoacyl peptidase
MIEILQRGLVVSALSLIAMPSMAEKLPARLFAQHPQYSAVAMSPDGRHLAITTPVDNRTDLMIVDIDGKSEPRRVRYRPNEHVIEPWWASDDRLVIGKGEKVGFLEQPFALGELYSTNIEMKEQRMLFGYEPDDGSHRGRLKDTGFASVIERVMPVDGDVIVQFQSWNDKDRKTYVYRVNASTASRKLIDTLDLERAAVSVDRAGVPRFAASVDVKGNPILRYRPTTDAPWQPVPATLAGRNMLVWAFAKDGNSAWAEISDKGEPVSMYRVDFAKGSREKILSSGRYETGAMMFAGFDPEPFAIYSNSPKPSIHYLDNESEWAKLHAGVMKQFPGNVATFVDFSRDNQKVLISVDGDRNPGQYFLLDRKNNSIAKILDSYEGIDPTLLAQTRVIEFDTQDGQKLSALLTVPRTGNSPFPMVVMSHGGPFGVADYWGFDTDTQFLASRGYAVLQVNYRGSGGRGDDFERLGYREWGGKIMDDIAAGVRWTIDQQVADKARICTYGASFGGYAALMNPIRYPDLYRCAVGYAGVYDVAYMATKGDIDDTKRGRYYVEETVGTDAEKNRAESPVHNVDKLRIPVLLIHGKDDRRVPLIHFKVMSEALKKAGRPPETLVKDAEGHGFYAEDNRIELYEKLEAFLDRHIGAAAAAK